MDTVIDEYVWDHDDSEACIEANGFWIDEECTAFENLRRICVKVETSDDPLKSVLYNGGCYADDEFALHQRVRRN